jgi:hypothetical protein
LRAARAFRREKQTPFRAFSANTPLLLTVSREGPFRLLPRSRRQAEVQQQLHVLTKQLQQKGGAMAMIFTDGMEIKTSGSYRIIEEIDGLYVVGNGLLCAVNSYAEGEKMISDLLMGRGDGSKTH